MWYWHKCQCGSPFAQFAHLPTLHHTWGRCGNADWVIRVFREISFQTLALVIALFRLLPKIHYNNWEWGQKLFWKLRALLFLTIFRFMTTEKCKTCITVSLKPALFICRVSSSSSCLPSLVNVNPKILKLLYLFQCRFIHFYRALIRVSWKMKYFRFGRTYLLIFHSAASHLMWIGG